MSTNLMLLLSWDDIKFRKFCLIASIIKSTPFSVTVTKEPSSGFPLRPWRIEKDPQPSCKKWKKKYCVAWNLEWLSERLWRGSKAGFFVGKAFLNRKCQLKLTCPSSMKIGEVVRCFGQLIFLLLWKPSLQRSENILILTKVIERESVSDCECRKEK